ncbi:MAG: nucleotide sugar dehydrogenase [Alphaproteobacteria bacterium]
MHNRKVAVVGLGYVGLPVAVALGNLGQEKVIAFDINKKRIAELNQGIEHTGEVDSKVLQKSDLLITDNVDDLRKADFFIITVPTPIDDAKRPDLKPVYSATKTVASALKRGDIVVYESTVYPGVTELECVPILEEISGLKYVKDFTVGYSPERINPSDKIHRLETITKVVSGSDSKTLDIVADVYGSIVHAGIHKAPSIMVAESAKVIENTQRDLNIALMNELAIIFNKMDIDTKDVLEAAGTKWNFLKFSPGLVGGHCIGVDPYYLTHRAERLGYHPQVILSGRKINDDMGKYVATQTIKHLMRNGIQKHPKIVVLGLTFKEDCPDIRNTRVVDIIAELKEFGANVIVCDPFADAEEVYKEYGLELSTIEDAKDADAVVFAVAHKKYALKGWEFISSLLKKNGGFVADVKSILDRDKKPENIDLWRL